MTFKQALNAIERSVRLEDNDLNGLSDKEAELLIQRMVDRGYQQGLKDDWTTFEYFPPEHLFV